MSYTCSNCGKPIANGQVGPCPHCKSADYRLVIDTSQNYSGSIAVSSTTVSAYSAIEYARCLLESIVASDPKRANFVTSGLEKLREAAKEVKSQEEKLVASKKSDWEEYEKKLAEYESIVDKFAEEPVFQTFFEKNANFLDPTVNKTYPKYALGGELIPDFLLIRYDSSYLFVEIEKPDVRLFDKTGKPTAPFTHALQQIRDQLKWVGENQDFLRKRECKNLTMDNFCGLLVVGKSTEFGAQDEERLQNINSEVRGRYVVKTFDQVLNENKAILENIRQHSK